MLCCKTARRSPDPTLKRTSANSTERALVATARARMASLSSAENPADSADSTSPKARIPIRPYSAAAISLCCADVDLGLECPAAEDRGGEVRPEAQDRVDLTLEHEQVARYCAPAVNAILGKRAALASATRLNAEATLFCARSRRVCVRATPKVARPAPVAASPAASSRPRDGRRVASQQYFKRAQRLLITQRKLACRITERIGIRLRQCQVVLVAFADAQAVIGELQRCSEERTISSASACCNRASTARIQLFATIAAIDWRAYSASNRADCIAAAGRARACASPDVEFPAGEQPDAAQAGCLRLLPPPRASKLTVG